MDSMILAMQYSTDGAFILTGIVVTFVLADQFNKNNRNLK